MVLTVEAVLVVDLKGAGGSNHGVTCSTVGVGVVVFMHAAVPPGWCWGCSNNCCQSSVVGINSALSMTSCAAQP